MSQDKKFFWMVSTKSQKKNTDEVLFRLKVEELELGNREDGRSFCRVWGEIDESHIQSYLFALDCKPI